MESMLTEKCITKLLQLTGVLIEAPEQLPSPFEIPEFNSILKRAVVAADLASEDIVKATEVLPAEVNLDTVRIYAHERPEQFELLALVCSGAYAMAPMVLERLGFPLDRQNPAGTMDAADEYDTGILDPVIGSTMTFRDPRTKD